MKYSAALMVPTLMVFLTATASAEWQADSADKHQLQAASEHTSYRTVFR